MSGRGRGGGRGAYYRARYGGGGRGGRGHSSTSESNVNDDYDGPQSTSGSRDWYQLQSKLQQIDRSQYGAYKQLHGRFHHASSPMFTLSVDYVQGDPFASPSRVRAIVPWATTGLPDEYLQSDIRKIALCDYVTRAAADFIRSKHLNQDVQGSGGGWSGPKGGSFNINDAGQAVLPRTSAMIDGTETIELRFMTTLPAAGRTVLGQEAWQILGVNLVELVKQSLLHANLNQHKLKQHVLSVERQESLRRQLPGLGLIAFVANGSILPRVSGATAGPMDRSKATAFRSPKEMQVQLTCPDGDKVLGLGIPRGITLLTGGGFHGKSTLLEALELGIYNHIPGDGREFVVTDPTAVKIRAEDGRCVSGVDISPFISDLPGGKDTERFSTDDASGSTSMASNIQEALEVGSKTLLIDEDSSATNLLVRDARMQALIKKEPITPLISKARALYNHLGVSTVIVIGGLGDWLSVSDNVIAMDSYVPRCITNDAQAIIQQFPTSIFEHRSYGSTPQRSFQVRFDGVKSPYAPRKNFISMKPLAKNPVNDPSEGEAGVDLSGLDQIVEVGQARAIATLLEIVAKETSMQARSLPDLLKTLDEAVGIDGCLPTGLRHGDFVAVRRFELAAVLSRLKGLLIE